MHPRRVMLVSTAALTLIGPMSVSAQTTPTLPAPSTLSDISRRKAEIRAEKSQAWLDKALAKVESYRDAQRRLGVEPGCLR